jgi:hypothetical protein
VHQYRIPVPVSGISNAPRKANSLNNRALAQADQKKTNCTDCRYGIYSSQVAVWTGRGLVHDYCEEERKRLLREAETSAEALPDEGSKNLAS